MIPDDKLHKGCLSCKLKNVAQADVVDPETGRILIAKGSFAINCKGIPADPVGDLVQLVEKSGLSSDISYNDVMTMAAVSDPVLWAGQNITVLDPETSQRGPWVPQGATLENIEKYGLDPTAMFYQELMTKCTAKRMHLRLGRRCLPGGEMVAMADGTLKPIADIAIGDIVLSFAEIGEAPVPQLVSQTYQNGLREIFKIKLNTGDEIRCTENHPLLQATRQDKNGPLLTGLRWTSLEDGLRVGDYVTTIKKLPFFGTISRPDEARLLGYLLTDGYLPERCQTPKFTSMTGLYHEEVDSLTFSIFGFHGWVRERTNEDNKASDYYFTDRNRGTANPIREWLRELKILGQKASTKRVPDFLFNADSETVSLFINRMFSGDGCAFVGKLRHGRQQQIEFALTSSGFELLKDIRFLLKKFGIESRIKEERNRNNWKLCISDSDSIIAFIDNIGPVYGKEDKSLEAYSIAKKCTRFRGRRGTEWYRPGRIVSIESIGYDETYDITVDGTHNFITDSIVSHNSGKSWTIIAKVLHRMVTQNDYRVLLVTPNISQLDLLFDQMNDFIGSSDTLHDSVERFRKTPQRYLKLKNGSYMIGFVSGGAGVRGQAADMIVLDEADYIDSADLAAIVAILTEHRETVLVVASTPTGSREQFYKWGHDPQFRPFHYPSMCRPRWNEMMEIEQKKELSPAKYEHEIGAKWGDIAEGVFQHTNIDTALESGDYEYGKIERNPDFLYTMGVDWNPVHGTEAVIIEVDTTTSPLACRVVDTGVVYREGHTQLQAIGEIIRLNRVWEPAAIYVDRGAGTPQIELLEEYGVKAPNNTPDKRLMNIVKAIDFGSKVEVRHPVTGVMIRDYAKPVVVENAVRFFESGRITISKFDDNLIRALRGYVVSKIGANGRQSYKMISKDIEDHRLDAFMLGLFAFTMEFTKLGKVERTTDVAYTGHFGEKTTPFSRLISIPNRDAIKPTSRSFGSQKEDALDISRAELEKEKELRFLPMTSVLKSLKINREEVERISYKPIPVKEYMGFGEKKRSGRSPIKRTNF